MQHTQIVRALETKYYYKGEAIMDEEYKMLREEIMFNIDKLHWYISVVYTAVIALLAYIIENPDNALLLLLVFVVLVCANSRIRSVTKSNIRISSYMQVILEPDLENRNWETLSHYKINNYDSHTLFSSRGNKFIDFISRTSAVCFLIGIFVFVLNCITIYENLTTINILCGALDLVLLIILGYFTYTNGSYIYRDECVKHWETVKRNNKNSKQDTTFVESLNEFDIETTELNK